jgi:hypothetical protein
MVERGGGARNPFRAVAGVSFRSAVRRAAPFKRPVYRHLLQEFGNAVGTLGAF